MGPRPSLRKVRNKRSVFRGARGERQMTIIMAKAKKWAGLGVGLYVLQALVGFGYGVYVSLQQLGIP